MTQSYLELQGQERIGAKSIADTNYSEFKDLESDLVKQVNAQNDENTQAIIDSATNQATWYNKMISTPREGNIAKLSKIANLSGKLKTNVTAFNNWRETERIYNDYYKTLNTEGVDTLVSEQNAAEENLSIQETEALLTAKSLRLKKNSFLYIDAMDVLGLKSDFLNKKENARIFKDKYEPLLRETLTGVDFWIPDGQGGLKLANLASVTSPEDHAELDAIIDKIALNEFRKAGYNEGFIRKYLLNDLQGNAELRAQEWTKETVAGIKVGNQTKVNQGLINDLRDGNTEALLKDIRIREIDGDLSVAQAKAAAFAPLIRAAGSGGLSMKEIEGIGNFTFKDTTGKTQKLKDYWSGLYGQLEAAGQDYHTQKLNAGNNLVAAEQNAFVNSAINQWGKTGMTLESVNKTISDFESQWPGTPLPTKLTSARNKAEFPQGDDHEKRLNYNLREGIMIDRNDVALLPDNKRKEFLQKIGFQGNKTLKASLINAALDTTLAWSDPQATGITRHNNLIALGAVYDAAHDQVMQEYAGSELDMVSRLTRAEQAANSAVMAELERIHGTKDEWDKRGKQPTPLSKTFRKVNQIDEKQLNENELVNKVNSGIKNNTIDIQQDIPFSNEEIYLENGLKVLTDGAPLDDYWRRVTKGLKIAPYDFMLARLEATGYLDEHKINASFTVEPGVYSYKVGPGHTLRLIQSGNLLQQQQNLAEALGVLAESHNLNNGGYEAILDAGGNQVELSKPLSQHTVLELASILSKNPNYTFGMYNINKEILTNLLTDATKASKGDRIIIGDDQLFDEDFQNSLILANLRYNQQVALQNNSVDTTWLYDVRFTKEDLKELEDILPLLKDSPWSHIMNLQPDVASAWIKANSHLLNK